MFNRSLQKPDLDEQVIPALEDRRQHVALTLFAEARLGSQFAAEWLDRPEFCQSSSKMSECMGRPAGYLQQAISRRGTLAKIVRQAP
jgi:hypothetical protein